MTLSIMRIHGIDQLSAGELREQLRQGARFIHFEYCISLIVVTWRQPSDIYLLPPGRRGVILGWPYLLVSLLLGWWGLPWGLFLTPVVLYTNLCGGKDVTAEVAALLEASRVEMEADIQQES